MKLHHWISTLVLLIMGLAQISQTSFASPSINAANTSGNISGSISANAAFVQAEQSSSDMLNINKASAQELSSLPGIGIKKAEAIVAYRELNGKFLSTDELVNVKGIGPKMLAKIAAKISV